MYELQNAAPSVLSGNPALPNQIRPHGEIGNIKINNDGSVELENIVVKTP